MKRYIYAIILAVIPALAFSLASCDDDKDLPDVSVTVNVENGYVIDNTIYVVQGDTLSITGLTVKNNDGSHKEAALANVRYFLNGYFVGNSLVAPFPYFNITSAETPVGTYNVGISCTVLAVDKSVATGFINYPVVVVANASDIPDGGEDHAESHLSLDL